MLTSLTIQAQSVVIADSFKDGERFSQELPNSAFWQTATPDAVSVEDQSIRFTRSNYGVRHIAAKITSAKDPIQLQIGEGLNVSFEFTPDSIETFDINCLRIGLFNVEGEGLFDGYNDSYSALGFAAILRSDLGQIRILERNNVSVPLISSLRPNAYPITLGSDAAQLGIQLVAGKRYQVSFEINRTSDSVLSFTASISDGTTTNAITTAYEAGEISSFDLLVIGLSSSVPSATIDNIILTRKKFDI